MIDITAMGELLIDFGTKSQDAAGYPTMAAMPGGAPCNFLSAAAKCGFQTAFLGKVGTDAFGSMLVNTLRQQGIETRGIVQSPDYFTTLAFVTWDAAGERAFSFARKPGADTQLSFDECDLSLVEEARIFHFGTLSLTDEPARSATKQLAAFAKARGKLLSFDPNLRKPLWNDLEQAKEAMLWGLSQADLVKISDEEVEFLWGVSPEEGLDRLLNECGVRLAFVTLGPDGALFGTKQHRGRAQCPRVTPVDTTGAGDNFGGSAAAQLLKTGKAIEELTAEELFFITAYACAAASLSTERFGGLGSAPEEADVLKRMVR